MTTTYTKHKHHTNLKCLKKFQKQAIAAHLEISKPTLTSKISDPDKFTVGDLKKLINFGVPRSALISEVLGEN